MLHRVSKTLAGPHERRYGWLTSWASKRYSRGDEYDVTSRRSTGLGAAPYYHKGPLTETSNNALSETELVTDLVP